MDMSEKIRKAQTSEPTKNPGEFGSVNRPESPINLVEAPLSDVEEHIKQVSEGAGLSGVMPGILELIHDRGDYEDDDWDEIILNLGSDDVTEGYDNHIAPAVDDIYSELEASASEAEPSTTSVEATETHIQRICDEAGYGGVMPGIIEVILERTENSPEMCTVINNLESDDIGRFYEEHVFSAVDDWQEHLEWMYGSHGTDDD